MMFDEAKERAKFEKWLDEKRRKMKLIDRIECDILPILRKDFPNTRFAISKWAFEEDDEIEVLYQHDDLVKESSNSLEKHLAMLDELSTRIEQLLSEEERFEVCVIEDFCDEMSDLGV